MARSRNLRARRRLPRPNRGISLVEALVATTITVMAGAAVLLAIGSALQTSNLALEQSIADGLAQSLIDEVAGTRYAGVGAGPRQWPLGPAAGEGPDRDSLDDIDDFARYGAQPPVDRWGVTLGQGNESGGRRHPEFRAPETFFDHWRREIDIYYVDDNDLSQPLAAGVTSNHRAIEVRVLMVDPNGSTRELSRLRRVFSYVPEP